MLAWDDIRLIRAIAETRNLPAAAQRLGIDHSTVFRRLRQVEAQLGTRLFERHRSGYALTPAGEEMAALGARMEQDITGVTTRILGQSIAPSGEVRLATSDSLLAELLLPMLVRLRARHPGIQLDLVTGNAALNLSRRDADIAVRATEQPPPTLVGRRVARIAWALYGAAGLGDQAPTDRVGVDWVGLGENLAGLQVVQALREVPPQRLAGRFDTVLGLAGAVKAGLGIGHLPCFLGDAWPLLRRLSPPEPAFASDLWLLTHPDLRQAPRIRPVMDLLAEEIAQQRPLIEGGRPQPEGVPVMK
ncbi:LysR family transcriptional regulator [Falsiroseomonas tokyonensis]|uniref:LysR family transcriptional regulator n=1 Tax=Falsiroseomonas tokyonensis TaxID=430521 RepID=A0ABV7C2T2_9PROT|nr:LysR family transcriptional regulator [Falsiroseomonas tokyonensis]